MEAYWHNLSYLKMFLIIFAAQLLLGLLYAFVFGFVVKATRGPQDED